MNIFSRRLLIGASTLFLFLGACNLPAGTPATPIGTILATGQITDTPLATSTSDGTPTAFIPITGMDVVSLQCQFCVNEEVRAVLIMSNQASFNVSDPASGITCFSVQEINDRRVLLCRGPQQASFQLNVCVGEANCLQFPITLQTCPLTSLTGTGTPFITFTPFFLTPINTLIPPTSPPSTPQPTQAPTQTGTSPPGPTSTPTSPPPPTSTTEPPTVEPTTQPPPTNTPSSAPVQTSTK